MKEAPRNPKGSPPAGGHMGALRKMKMKIKIKNNDIAFASVFEMHLQV
jgi:hypothetical protein